MDFDTQSKYTQIKEIKNFKNHIKNSVIIIYPSENIRRVPIKFLENNKVVAVGPDSGALEVINLFKLRLPKIHYLFETKFFKFFSYLIFDFIFNKKYIKLVVGKDDMYFLKKYEKKMFTIYHIHYCQA